ncbi:MAG: cyclic nucleotide-binding domain-containing protein, partial [Leptospiraceae bacterium]|nr:cyclic nucleotide-binding domain-containing protein [Leptospiraceae bacterium]
DYITSMPSRFGVTVLGGASGFIYDKPCSGLLLNYNSDYMLIDCVPYLEQSLNARGISKKEVKSIFLTHVHDDHCNIFPLLDFSHKIKFLATKEVYWMALKKLSLQTLLPISEFYDLFDFVELTAYERTDFYGVSIVPHYTVHSIPTIGETFKMKHGHTERSVVFVGDNKSFDDIEQMVKDGIVKKGKQEPLLQLYTDRYDILFADGGMGILHGNPTDALQSKSDRIVFMHLEKLPKEFDATFSTASAGKRYTIIPGSDNSYAIKALQIITDTFPDISNDWTTALLNNFEILSYNVGDIIFKQKEESRGVIYIILSGSCSIMVHDGETLHEKARKEAGDFVGEMAVLDKNKIRSASVVARTPVNLCSIDEDLFYEFLVAE